MYAGLGTLKVKVDLLSSSLGNFKFLSSALSLIARSFTQRSVCREIDLCLNRFIWLVTDFSIVDDKFSRSRNSMRLLS